VLRLGNRINGERRSASSRATFVWNTRSITHIADDSGKVGAGGGL
jgi:hypothetical protein